MGKQKFWILAIILFMAGSRGGFAGSNVNPEILLGSPKEAFELPSIKKVQTASTKDLAERYKIEYLILRVKKSPYLFIRNGEEHKGERASMHLKMKYYKRFQLIKTADKFIAEIASFSRHSGEPYQVKYPDGSLYLLQDIFYNELALLDTFLPDQKSSPGAG